MDEKRLEELARSYDHHDLGEEIARGELKRHEPVPADRFVVVPSIRLPKPAMDRVRAAASAEGVDPAVLMRRWIEERSTLWEESEDTGPRTGS
ncbi:hypothetical protein [Nocardiopsis sp. CNT312]|uniref:hypothetical protein n=1 Tax=Nocardiopsis sp. CNT312 TaxID=1137268 RepID=UPI000491EB98|nr:hypothetical protein [Nocardiopsis sp. CNT312]